MKYQDYSLIELTKVYQDLTGEKISKSGIKHRLDKISAIAKELE